MYELAIAIIIIILFVICYNKSSTEYFNDSPNWDISDIYTIRRNTKKCNRQSIKNDPKCDRECQCAAIDKTLKFGTWNNYFDPVYAYNIWKKAYPECNKYSNY